jgi:hypothetical protein
VTIFSKNCLTAKSDFRICTTPTAPPRPAAASHLAFRCDRTSHLLRGGERVFGRFSAGVGSTSVGRLGLSNSGRASLLRKRKSPEFAVFSHSAEAALLLFDNCIGRKRDVGGVGPCVWGFLSVGLGFGGELGLGLAGGELRRRDINDGHVSETPSRFGRLGIGCVGRRVWGYEGLPGARKCVKELVKSRSAGVLETFARQ